MFIQWEKMNKFSIPKFGQNIFSLIFSVFVYIQLSISSQLECLKKLFMINNDHKIQRNFANVFILPVVNYSLAF